eukprot:Rhum_TRINITY_DN14246_c3_g1::Rhum_TRINITY_DN14246_c3_g1_i1::g.75691::m.75691
MRRDAGADQTVEERDPEAHLVGLPADDGRRQLPVVTDQRHLRRAVHNGHNARRLRRLRRLVEQHGRERHPVEDVGAGAGARGAHSARTLQALLLDAVDLLPVLRVVAVHLRGDRVEGVLVQVAAHALGAADTQHVDACGGKPGDEVVDGGVAVGGAEHGADAGVEPGLHNRHGRVRLTCAGRSVNEGKAPAERRLDGITLRNVETLSQVDVPGQAGHDVRRKRGRARRTHRFDVPTRVLLAHRLLVLGVLRCGSQSTGRQNGFADDGVGRRCDLRLRVRLGTGTREAAHTVELPREGDTVRHLVHAPARLVGEHVVHLEGLRHADQADREVGGHGDDLGLDLDGAPHTLLVRHRAQKHGVTLHGGGGRRTDGRPTLLGHQRDVRPTVAPGHKLRGAETLVLKPRDGEGVELLPALTGLLQELQHQKAEEVRGVLVPHFVLDQVLGGRELRSVVQHLLRVRHELTHLGHNRSLGDLSQRVGEVLHRHLQVLLRKQLAHHLASSSHVADHKCLDQDLLHNLDVDAIRRSIVEFIQTLFQVALIKVVLDRLRRFDHASGLRRQLDQRRGLCENQRLMLLLLLLLLLL